MVASGRGGVYPWASEHGVSSSGGWWNLGFFLFSEGALSPSSLRVSSTSPVIFLHRYWAFVDSGGGGGYVA